MDSYPPVVPPRGDTTQGKPQTPTRAVTYGSLDDDEMPQYGAPPKRAKPKRSTPAPTEGSHAWVVDRFASELARVGVLRFDYGPLHAALKRLREQGYANTEIADLIERFTSETTFYARGADPSIRFRAWIKRREIRSANRGGRREA